VAGAHDQLRPPDHVQTIARQIPGAHFEVIESGHYIPVQTPEKAVELMAGLLERARF
jgi:pimeloyl-ACP methyl ester carboxylesterase